MNRGVEQLVSLLVFVYFVVCVEYPAWTLIHQDVYFKIVDPTEVGLGSVCN